MKSFHFSLGDSADGPCGFCARIEAETAEAAVDILKNVLKNADEIEIPNDGLPVDYIRAYFNPDAIGVDDIDDEEDLES